MASLAHRFIKQPFAIEGIGRQLMAVMELKYVSSLPVEEAWSSSAWANRGAEALPHGEVMESHDGAEGETLQQATPPPPAPPYVLFQWFSEKSNQLKSHLLLKTATPRFH